MNIFLFTQDIDLFREMFIYITQHYTRNTAISQEKVLSAHFAAFSLPDSSPTSADAAPSCPAIPAAALPARVPNDRSPAHKPYLLKTARAAPPYSPIPAKKLGKFLPEHCTYSFSLFSSLSDSSPSSVSSSGTSSGSLASDASSAAASAS